MNFLETEGKSVVEKYFMDTAMGRIYAKVKNFNSQEGKIMLTEKKEGNIHKINNKFFVGDS